MEKAVRYLFNLHPGEGTKSLLFILLGLLWSIGTYGMFTLSEGMFIEHIGANHLPVTYVFVALTLCLISTCLIFALNHLSIRKILFIMISFWAAVIFVFYACLPLSDHIMYWYLLKVFGWVMPISTYICYWAFIDQYVDLQVGKRLFCLINSVTYLGDACGSGVISIGIGRLGLSGLLILFAAVIICSLPCIYLITQKLSPILEDHADHIDTRSSLSLKDIAKRVLNSRFTVYLLGFYFIMQLLAIVTEFSYMNAFDTAFSGTSEHDLTRFLGTCNMWIAIANVLFGSLVYSRLIKKMGINNVIVIAPAFFLLLFSISFWKQGIPIAIFGLFAREGMVYTFDDNNLNLLISGVPTKIKNQIRITVESFFEPIGMLISALILLILHNYSRSLGLTVSIGACILVLLLRANYSKAIFTNLMASSIRFGKKAIDWIPKKEKKQFEHYLLQNLKRPEESGRLLAFDYLLRLNNEKHLPHLLNYVSLMSIPGKLQAIELLSQSSWAKEPSVIERLERWRRTLPHPAIRGSIHLYFAKHALLRPEKITQDLHSDLLPMRAAAILSLKTITPRGGQLPSFVSLASEKLRLLLDSKIEYEICTGIDILGAEENITNIESILTYLKHPSLKVKQSSAKALKQISNPDTKEYASQIISLLPSLRDPITRLNLLRSLEKMKDRDSVRELILATVHFRPNERALVQDFILELGMDKEMAQILLSIVKDTFIHERCRLLAGKILAKIDLNLLKNHLYPLLRNEIDRAYFYYYHFATVQKQLPGYDLSILENALETGYHSVIDFVIQLLGSASELEQSDVLSYTLKSKNPKIRAQAIETLQKTCHSRLFSLLEPLIDEPSIQQKLRTYLKRGNSPLSISQLLDTMVYSPSLTDQIVAIDLKAKLNSPGWEEILKKKLKGNEEIFQHFAHELLQGTT